MTSIAAISTPARRRKLVGAGRRQWIGLLYVAPAVALVVVFFIIPLCMTAWMSLHNWPLMGAHALHRPRQLLGDPARYQVLERAADSPATIR